MNALPPRISRKSDKAEKRCVACDVVLEPKAYEKPSDFKRRETCGRSCANRVRETWTTPHEMLIHNTHVSKLSGCWEWQGYLDAKGYGRCGMVNGETLVHRVAYSEKYGAVPGGLHVLHKCDNPRCCNTDHLFLGTNDDNVRDRVLKGRSARNTGTKNGNYKHGRHAGKTPARRSATVKEYWDWLPNACPCGCDSECVHHVIHVNRQRITKDDWLVVKLCNNCHRDLHTAGGDRQFEEQTGLSTVHLALLNRHNFEVREKASPHRFKMEADRG
jgi:hypothetical protein